MGVVVRERVCSQSLLPIEEVKEVEEENCQSSSRQFSAKGSENSPKRRGAKSETSLQKGDQHEGSQSKSDSPVNAEHTDRSILKAHFMEKGQPTAERMVHNSPLEDHSPIEVLTCWNAKEEDCSSGGEPTGQETCSVNRGMGDPVEEQSQPRSEVKPESKNTRFGLNKKQQLISSFDQNEDRSQGWMQKKSNSSLGRTTMFLSPTKQTVSQKSTVGLASGATLGQPLRVAKLQRERRGLTEQRWNGNTQVPVVEKKRKTLDSDRWNEKRRENQLGNVNSVHLSECKSSGKAKGKKTPY